jgi:hypothetical protein
MDRVGLKNTRAWDFFEREFSKVKLRYLKTSKTKKKG